MKKILILLFIVSLLIPLFSCAKQSDQSSSSISESESSIPVTLGKYAISYNPKSNEGLGVFTGKVVDVYTEENDYNVVSDYTIWANLDNGIKVICGYTGTASSLFESKLSDYDLVKSFLNKDIAVFGSYITDINRSSAKPVITAKAIICEDKVYSYDNLQKYKYDDLFKLAKKYIDESSSN